MFSFLWKIQQATPGTSAATCKLIQPHCPELMIHRNAFHDGIKNGWDISLVEDNSSNVCVTRPNTKLVKLSQFLVSPRKYLIGFTIG